MNGQATSVNNVSEPESNRLKTLFRSAPRWIRWTRKQDVYRLATDICIQHTQLNDSATHDSQNIDPGNKYNKDDATRIRPLSDARPREFFNHKKYRARMLLADAEGALSLGDIDAGWKFLQELEREKLALMSDDALQARWISAMEEAAEKLTGWRSKSVSRLVLNDALTDETISEPTITNGSQPLVLPRDREQALAKLSEVLLHLHSRHQNIYLNIRRLRTQITVVAWFVTAMVIAVLMLNRFDFFNQLGQTTARDLPLAILSGLLGGVLSVAYSVARTSPTQKIPDAKASFTVTVVRPVIGAAVALPMVVFIESGILNISPSVRLWFILALCFIAGFSERWFLGVVQKLETRNL